MDAREILFELGSAMDNARALEAKLEKIRQSIAHMSEQALEAQPQEDAIEIPPETARMLAEGERAYGRMKAEFSLSGLDIPAGAIVTRYLKGDAEKFRMWVGERYRHKSEKWLSDRCKRVRSTARILRGEQNRSATKAQAEALKAHNAGTEAQEAPVVPATPDTTAKPSKAGRQVSKHNAGDCTCKTNWLCPAAQAYGRKVSVVDGIEYAPGAHVTGFDLKGASATLTGRLSELWS